MATQNVEEMDPIQKINYEATVNMGRQDLITREYTFYSDYEFIPIQEDRKQQMEDALNNLHKIIHPTVTQLKKKANVQEIQDRIYRKLQGWEGELNTCVFSAKNVRDSNYCADRFTNRINTEGVEFVKQILREY
ncbi:hypothetical protein ABPG72_019875 [Tetrahymena utriculariae]